MDYFHFKHPVFKLLLQIFKKDSHYIYTEYQIQYYSEFVNVRLSDHLIFKNFYWYYYPCFIKKRRNKFDYLLLLMKNNSTRPRLTVD